MARDPSDFCCDLLPFSCPAYMKTKMRCKLLTTIKRRFLIEPPNKSEMQPIKEKIMQLMMGIIYKNDFSNLIQNQYIIYQFCTRFSSKGLYARCLKRHIHHLKV
ncbi:hypothetical protein IEQ34_004260 [Dendrobium chrysotoxum]|uniref:Uncharacterized protein n=1 Tax=Dendrobium chrysotoxum TaxID=161865 RepID=A0AAV7HDU8_DENCH|nr:hypothetical protein IEQ34_004260 [Dendrobium chrysotoxum]